MNAMSSSPTPAAPATVDCDLLVIGSGAAGLSAAVTAAWHGLKVIVAEKDPVCGGATALSGGWMWVPLNPVSLGDGTVDDPAEVRRYLRHELGEQYDPARIEAFLENGPRMVDFFSRHTALQFVSGSWIADIHGGSPGAGTGGRSVAPQPFDARRLDRRLLGILRYQKYETSLLGMGIMAGPDLGQMMRANRSASAFLYATGRLMRHMRDLLVHGRGMQLVNGCALVARLMKSADALKVEFRVSSPARRLIEAGGRVVGAELDTPTGRVEVRSRCGVVLAAGGFPHDIERRKKLFPRTPTGAEHWSLAPPAASGDGLAMAEAVGGSVADRSLASPVAWCPVSEVRYPGGRTGLYPHIIDRGKPGLIAVLADGRRFVNEANGYHDVVSAMVKAVPEGQEVASWLICDHRFQRRYPFGMSKPFPVPVWPYVRSGYLQRGRTLEALALQCGIDPKGLVRTVSEYNLHARSGQDPAFGRGSTLFNRRSGDPDQQPNPCVAPIGPGPFYAIKVRPGSFGTFAGLRTDPSARVLREDGAPIAGLYAVGCDQASVMGGHYPSGGINLGPAMTFGYIAGCRAAGADPT